MTAAQKNLALVGVLVVLAGGLGFYAYFGVRKPEEREAQRKESAEKLFSAHTPEQKQKPDGGAPAEAEFTAINIRAKGETTTLEKRDSRWWVTSPVFGLADKWAVDQIISQIRNTRFKSTVDENPSDADLAKYGLKDPSFTVNAYYSLPESKAEANPDAGGPYRGREKITFYGGIDNPFDGSVYLRREGDKAVYLVEGSIRNSIDKNTFDLRDKEILSLDESNLKRVEASTAKGHYVLERDDKNNWQIVVPKAMSADTAAVSTILSGLRNARATAFITDSPEQRQRLGFSSPTAQALFTFTSGQPIQWRFKRVPGDGGEKTYVLREQGAESTLAEISSAPIADLSKDPNELRDKSVISFTPDQVAKAVFVSPSGPELIVAKETTDGGSENWRVLGPQKGPAKRWKITSALWSLSSLKALAVGEESPKDWRKYGITDASRRVSLFGADGKLLASLVIGKAVPGKSNTLYARGQPNWVAEVDSSKLSELPNRSEDVLETASPSLDGGSN
jgi:hypothetical protein